MRLTSTAGSRIVSGQETPTRLQTMLQQGVNDTEHLDASVSNRIPIPKTLDEQSDSAARKCLMYFGPGNNPRLTIGSRNKVAVDCGGKIHLIDDLNQFKKTVGARTWSAVTKLADELREKKIKIGFFSSTPQGGGVALVRTSKGRIVTRKLMFRSADASCAHTFSDFA
jgi:hypothetical protein